MFNSIFSSALLVSFPEELLIVITTLAASGRKDLLNFKNKSNIFKLLFSVSLMVVVSLTIDVFCSFSFRFLINAVLFYVIIVSVYRQKPFSFILGFISSIVLLIASEFLFYPLFIRITGLSSVEVSNSTFYKLTFSSVDRVTQIVSFLVICKIRGINLKPTKIYVTDWVIIAIYFLIIASNFFLLDIRLKNMTGPNMSISIEIVLNSVLIAGFSLWLIKYIFELRQKMFVKENVHDVELHHLKQLILEGKKDYAVELIDLTLNNRGYYSDEL